MSAPHLSAGHPHPDSAPSPRMIEVAERVYAWVQEPGGWCLSNAGVLVDDSGVVVVDTLATERRARALRDAVEGLRPGPRRTIVNTHHHGDHTFGNAQFGSATAIVAHDHARTEMAETGLALRALWPDVDWGNTEVTLPTITFKQHLTIHLGDRPVELLHVGPAHTTNDVVAWLPDERILFAGDLVLNGSTPFNLMGSIRGAIEAVALVRSLGVSTVVCGHGAIGGPELFDQTTAYLRWVQEVAAAAIEAGVDPLEAARSADLGPYADLLDPERLVGNLHRAYAEVSDDDLGRPLDVAAIFGEMVAFNGGTLPTCLA